MSEDYVNPSRAIGNLLSLQCEQSLQRAELNNFQYTACDRKYTLFLKKDLFFQKQVRSKPGKLAIEDKIYKIFVLRQANHSCKNNRFSSIQTCLSFFSNAGAIRVPPINLVRTRDEAQKVLPLLRSMWGQPIPKPNFNDERVFSRPKSASQFISSMFKLPAMWNLFSIVSAFESIVPESSKITQRDCCLFFGPTIVWTTLSSAENLVGIHTTAFSEFLSTLGFPTIPLSSRCHNGLPFEVSLVAPFSNPYTLTTL